MLLATASPVLAATQAEAETAKADAEYDGSTALGWNDNCADEYVVIQDIKGWIADIYDPNYGWLTTAQQSTYDGDWASGEDELGNANDLYFDYAVPKYNQGTTLYNSGIDHYNAGLGYNAVGDPTNAQIEFGKAVTDFEAASGKFALATSYYQSAYGTYLEADDYYSDCLTLLENATDPNE